MRHASRLAVVLVVLSAISSIGVAQCGVAWSEQFASPQVFGGACMAVHDDGSGPALYIGISPAFPYSGYPVAYGVVRWRGPGSKVQSVGGHSALGSGVRAFAVFDDGSGPALYATGSFTSTGSIACNHIARWNGSVWLPLGAGLDGPGRALAVYDDGSGPALWVGGEFTTAGGLSSPRLAKWNGTAWSAVVTSMTPYGTMSPFVNSLAVFDSGSGARLYASGVFGSINGVATTCIASTNGSAWLSHDAGILASSWPPIEKIAVHDAGSGPALYAAGQFDVVGGSPVDNVARWDGSSWSGVGGGIAGGVVKTLTSWNTPTGPKLVVGGSYTFPGRTDFWDGTSWTSISGHGASAACAFDAGDGNRLYLVGDIAQTGFNQATVTDIFQCFDGQTWSTPASHGFRPYDEVRALAVHDDGSGPQLYATGNFPFADGNVVGYVARWNGTRWSPVGTGLPSSMVSSPPYQLVTIGSVPSGPFAGLYASLAGQTIKWDGTTWTNVDPYGMAALSCVGSFDLGNGPVLVGSGGFNIPPPYAVQGVASWTGTTWSLIGPAFGGAQSGGIAWALERFDDGSGPALYAAGDFGSIGGAPVNRVAKWNGAAWVPLGQGLTGADGVATSLEVFDDGTGPALYAAGSFTTAGGFPAANIAKWNGTAWSPLSTGLNGKVMSLVTFNDGNGSKLYAGGYFTTAGGVDASRVACWNGTSWSPVQSGVAILPFYTWTEPDVVARALAVYAPPGEDPSLFVGGRFNDAGGATSANFAALVPSRPRLSISQTGGVASGVVLTNSNLEIGAEYFNVFSAEPAPLGPGTGPYLGLYATSLDPLLAQISMPLEAPPFHYTTPVASISFGPYPVPPGVVIEGVCFRLNGTQVGCSSTNPRLSVQ